MKQFYLLKALFGQKDVFNVPFGPQLKFYSDAHTDSSLYIFRYVLINIEICELFLYLVDPEESSGLPSAGNLEDLMGPILYRCP